MTQSNAFVLKSIEVKNWKTFTEATLNLESNGLTGIIGQNGSGKSSFVDAILWCLYGHRPKDVTNAALRRRKSDPTKDETQVRVTFTHAGQTVEVFRSMKTKRHTVTAGIFLDGTEVTVATGTTAENWITHRLGMDADGFKTAVVVPQKELDTLVDARPAPRREHIEKLAGIETLNLAVKQAREQENTLAKQVKVLPGSLEDVEAATVERDNLAGEFDEVEKDLVNATAEVQEIKAKSDEVEQQSSSARTSLREAIALNNEKVDLRHKMTLAKSQVTDLASQIESIQKDVEGVDVSQRSALEAQYKEVNGEYSALSNKVAVHQNNLANAKREVASLVESRDTTVRNLLNVEKSSASLRETMKSFPSITDLGAEVSVYENDISEAKGVIASANTLITDLKESIRLISAHEHEGATCPTCHSELKDPSKLVAQFNENIKDAEKRIEDAKNRGRTATEKLNATRAKIEEIQSNTRKLSDLQESYSDLHIFAEEQEDLLKDAQARLDTLVDFNVEEAEETLSGLDKRKREIISAGEKIASAEKALNRMNELIERKSQMEAEIVPNKERIDALNETLDEFGDLALLEETVNNFDATLSEYREKYSQAFTRMKDVESMRASLAERLKAAEANLNREEKLAEAKKVAYAKLEEKSAVSDLLDEYRKERIARIAPELSATATDLISQMTNGRFIEVIVKDDFATGVVKSDGMEYAVAELSGGEKSVVALALRIAIGSLITGENAGLLWLDEVLPAQDKERRDAILNVLRSLPIQQIVMINHTHEAEDVVDRVVKISYDGEGSTIAE